MNATPRPWHRKSGVPFQIYGDSKLNSFVASTEPEHAEFDLAQAAENAKMIVQSVNAYDSLVEALKLHKRFWDEMPKGQLGRICCDIGILNEAFLKTRKALADCGEK